MKKYFAEFIGTALLVLLGCGAVTVSGDVVAKVSGGADGGFVYLYLGLAIALAFGLAVFAVIAAFGKISGAHVNPAVTLAMAINGRISFVDALGYMVAQFLGGIFGGALLFVCFPNAGSYGANGYDYNSTMEADLMTALILEAVLTFAFVLVVLFVTKHDRSPVSCGAAIGAALTAVHIIGIPITGTSVNPARSFGVALFSGMEYLSQVWVFFVGPFVGAAVAGAVYLLFEAFSMKKEVIPEKKAE